jgi:hypothetical protein
VDLVDLRVGQELAELGIAIAVQVLGQHGVRRREALDALGGEGRVDRAGELARSPRTVVVGHGELQASKHLQVEMF